MKLTALFQHENALPIMPALTQELIDSFSDDQLAMDVLARRIALDPVLGAQVLRLANSAYYRVSRQIGSIEAAVALLGFDTVRTLVITCSLVARFKAVPGIDLRGFWSYSLTTAVTARWLAGALEEGSVSAELAFTGGLGHALGELILFMAAPQKMQAIAGVSAFHAEQRLQLERDLFAFDYLDVSAELLQRWKFPAVIAHGVAAMRQPLQVMPAPEGEIQTRPQASLPAAYGQRLAIILHLASWLARGDAQGRSDTERRAQCPPALLQALAEASRSQTAAAGVLENLPPLSRLRADLLDLVQ